MDIQHYFSIIMHRKWIIIATFLVTMMAVIIITIATTPVYTANAIIRIATAAGTTGSYTDYMYADRIMNTYVQIATSTPVLEQLKQSLHIQELPQIQVEIVPTTELIRITVEATHPIFAADVANYLSNILISQSETLYSGGGKSPVEILNEQLNQLTDELSTARSDYEYMLLNSPDNTDQLSALNQSINLKQEMYASVLEQYEQARVREALRANTISVVEPAAVPQVQSKPNKLLNIALGIVVGLGGGLGLAVLFELLDTTLYTSEQIEATTQLPVWGEIPTIRKKKEALSVNGSYAQLEAFRRLRTKILGANHDSSNKAFMVTSAEPGEGKSTVMVNLAISLSQSEKKVILIDCDMRRPTLNRYFNLPNIIGLSSYLEHKVSLDDVIQPIAKYGIKVITSGRAPADPSQLLGGEGMTTLIDRLRLAYDYVLLDAPTLLGIADAIVLSQWADGVLLVVSRNQATQKSVQIACKQLSGIREKTIAVVINRVEESRKYGYYQRSIVSRNPVEKNKE